MRGELPTRDNMLRFVDILHTDGMRNCAEVAQRWVNNARASRDADEQERLAWGALRYTSFCVDAYLILADKAATHEDAVTIYRRGVDAAEMMLGRDVFNKKRGEFWWLPETRPYMQARAGLADALWQAGHQEEALFHYRELLELDPHDNQCLRREYGACLKERGDIHELNALIDRFSRDKHLAAHRPSVKDLNRIPGAWVPPSERMQSRAM